MTYELIETFLAVVTYGNITAAAKQLYISQSTVSSRIQLLEQELGVKLFIREKGHRSITLTNYGNSFIPVASQWASLWKKTMNLKTLQNIQTLTIASIDAVNNCTLPSFFNECISRFPDIRLSIRIHHSDEIHSLVENRIADIGFVFKQSNYTDIISKPIYRELMYLICKKDSSYHDLMDPTALKIEDEIFLNWGMDYMSWHDSHIMASGYHIMEVNTGSMLQHYLHSPNRWAIAPMSVVDSTIKADPELTYYTLQDPPPPRICYELTNRYPSADHLEAMAQFDQALQDFINNSDNICSFEDWMLTSGG